MWDSYDAQKSQYKQKIQMKKALILLALFLIQAFCVQGNATQTQHKISDFNSSQSLIIGSTQNQNQINQASLQNKVSTYKQQSIQSEQGKLQQETNQIVFVVNQALIKSKGSFCYLKNIVQFTLLAYIVHNFLSTWILASLYYFLPYSPEFVRNLLLILWKTYNTSSFSLFNIEQPQLPRLNFQQSTMDYGDIIISNDFVQFTFDPFVMCVIALIIYCISLAIKKTIEVFCQSKQKVRLPSCLKGNLFQSISDIIIQLLPVLFLPSTNFISNMHYSFCFQRINLVLFTIMGGFGILFPFLYFSKLIKNASKNRQKIKRQEQINKNINQNQNKRQDIKMNKNDIIPYEDSLMKYLKSARGQNQKQVDSANQCKVVNSINKNMSKMLKDRHNYKIHQQKETIFYKTRCKQIDCFLTSILHLTIPISVTLTTPWPFFILNGVLILWAVINSLSSSKNRLNTFLRRVYFMLYHCSFIVMYVSQTKIVHFWAGVFALTILCINFIHQILHLLSRVVKSTAQMITECRKKNKIRDTSKPNQSQAYTQNNNKHQHGSLKINNWYLNNGQIYDQTQKRNKQTKRKAKNKVKQLARPQKNKKKKQLQSHMGNKMQKQNNSKKYLKVVQNAIDFFQQQSNINQHITPLQIQKIRESKQRTKRRYFRPRRQTYKAQQKQDGIKQMKKQTDSLNGNQY